ncbi:MAG TPA: universal stress protein, partial [Blastocatellia bacterium]|nr:universal stress protein [Blastocatellia bacterium]
LLLGSVSQKVVNEAPCSVRIGRGRKREADAPLRIMIGVDGSPGSEAALKAVAAREWPGGTEVRVVAVPDLLMVTLIEWVEEGDEDDAAWVRRMVDASVEKLRAAGLDVSSEIRNGDAKRVLISEAEKWGADTVFVGARGLRRIKRFLLGSVSAAVAARAHCSVEVVRTKKISAAIK